MRKISIAALASLLVLGATVGSASAGFAQEQEEANKSLYDRLGGVYAISAVVDSFLERLLVNDVVNANAAVDAARGRVPKAGLKFQLATLICEVTGGPQAYKGRSMKDSHSHLGITEEQWVAMAADFKHTLDSFGVPEAEQNELFAIVATTKKDIVVPNAEPTTVDVKAIYPASADTSLYGRLGGVYSIATVVDAFIERLLVNDTLNANPAISESRHNVPKAGLKNQVTALVCEATGGPYAYAGRNMKDSHAHPKITEAEWQAMLVDFIATLDSFDVPAAEQKELIAVLGSTHDDIVIDHD